FGDLSSNLEARFLRSKGVKIWSVLIASRTKPLFLNAGKNVEREAPHEALQVLIDPLAELVTNLEFRAALEVFRQANRDVVVPVNPNVGTLTTKARDFTRMIPSEFHGSKVEEEPQEFIDEVY
ncbi:hypothetical protein MTR67_012197, partial [Solanum verrucosum]